MRAQRGVGENRTGIDSIGRTVASITIANVAPFVLMQFAVAGMIVLPTLGYRTFRPQRAGRRAMRYLAYTGVLWTAIVVITLEVIAFSLLTADL